jgi:hypothetical protein
MAETCHLCGSTVAENGASASEIDDAFVCDDCGKLTCNGCKSIGVARSTDHCKRCRG